ncbi:patatin-like phospholipase family protein [Rhodoferax sp.]|uniref:patatin-like phospholipase family protein n=1 Tax=Rhodoferax sp. TaxID=50421 RepID=UPI002726D59A|nr:patatin-like phospholipase family protein [Rhodoferax sp.]MDO9197722.1 patatin-like phospholipase family protein [Rhodoferax sp.]
MIDSETPRRPGVTAQSGLALLKRLLGSSPSRLNLALQGGGAHGAFTWGVLDALLEDPRIRFEGLSGSSAGAMNAVVFADGWMKGGRDGARQGLADFWTEVGKQMPSGMVTQGEGDAFSLSPASKLFVKWAGYFSPSQLNPLDLNPLRGLLNRQVDFEQLRARSPFKLFVGTTQANTGKLRIFRETELTVDVLLASACLPTIHHSVEIDGEPYWDGGYSANPAVYPLFYECDSRDVMLVLLNPLKREGTPRTLPEIEARIVELAFSANFMREMRMFAHATEFSSPTFLTMGRLERRLQKMRFHMIDASHLESLQRTETKLLAHGPFLDVLRGQGRECASAWLSAHSEGIGSRSTVDMKKWLA